MENKRTLRLALLHFDFCGGPQETNLKKIEEGVRLAAEAGADWVITPEMALQGYHMVRTGHPYTYLSREDGSYGPFLDLARENHVRLFLGCAEKEAGRAGNSCVVIGPEGTIDAKHSKVHTVKWITEAWSDPGETMEPADLDGIRTGLLVCADSWFNHHGEELIEKGAELLLVIAAWPPGGCGGPPVHAWNGISTWAHGLPVIICNQTGNSGMDCRKAQSAVVEGGRLLFQYVGGEAILLMEIDREEKKILSKDFTVLPVSLGGQKAR